MNCAAISFDLENARACVQASADAYGLTSTLGDTTALGDAGTDTHCLIIERADEIIIAFRGTKSIRNWIEDGHVTRGFDRNLLLEDTDGSRCEVHGGFLCDFESLIPAISAKLHGPLVVRRPIFLTGHSLGGALAILCALELVRQKFFVAQVYTFGQPRVGNAAFKALYEATPIGQQETLGSQTYRIVYQEDVVPRVPHVPAWHDLYRHAGTEIFVSSYDSSLWIDPPWWRLLISDAWGIWRAWCIRKWMSALEPLHDHQIFLYQHAMAGAAQP